jgi:hypothetical protein
MVIPLVYVLALVLAGQGAVPAQPTPVAPPDVLAFVRDALQQRLDANAVPDFDLTRRTAARVAIREDMPAAQTKLNQSALPHVDGVEFYLLSTAAAQAQADATRSDVTLLIVDSPQIRGASGRLLIGMDIVLWHDPAHPRLKMCCCDAEDEFAQTENRWVFTRRFGMMCR